jgi:electron transfer flavoprotein alpha/beta subunit
MTRVVTLVRRGGALPLARGLGEISTVSLVRPEDESRLPDLRASGAARVYALWDDVLADTDYYGVAQALAAATRQIGFDLVVCSDGDRSSLGPAVAERLAVPHLSGIVSARWDGERLVVRRLAGGEFRSYAAQPPVVLCTIRGGAAAPPPAAEPQAVERLTLGSLGISGAELRWRRRFAPRSAAGGPTRRPGLFPDAESLARRLSAEGLLPPSPKPAPLVEEAPR